MGAPVVLPAGVGGGGLGQRVHGGDSNRVLRRPLEEKKCNHKLMQPVHLLRAIDMS